MSRALKQIVYIAIVSLISFAAKAAPVLKCNGKEVTGGEANKIGISKPDTICEKITKVQYDSVSGKWKSLK